MGHGDRGKGWSLHSVCTYSYDQGHNSRCRRGIGVAGVWHRCGRGVAEVWHRCGIGVANCTARNTAKIYLAGMLDLDIWFEYLGWDTDRA